MPVVSFGSLNLDMTYRVPRIITAGETMSALELTHAAGGKGLNQAAALSKAGCPTWMAGHIGDDGTILLDTLENIGVATTYVRRTNHPTGHALIQLDAHGENCIIVYGGANHHISAELIDAVFAALTPDDLVVLQNEIRPLTDVWQAAVAANIPIAFNPSPFDAAIEQLDVFQARYLFVNQGEARAIIGVRDAAQYQPEALLAQLTARYPTTQIVMTMGAKGAYWGYGKQSLYAPSIPTTVVDTTGAGDTFTGFFLASIRKQYPPDQALRIAAQAASIAVSRPGAAVAIPTWDEVLPLI